MEMVDGGGWWWDIIRAVVGWSAVGWSTGLVRAWSRHIKLWNLKKIGAQNDISKPIMGFIIA